MARRYRIRFCGAIYHIAARGNRKGMIFVDEADRRRFLRLVAMAVERFGAECFAYCLMDNHVHLIIRTPRANIPSVMQRIKQLFTQYFNWRHHTTGHVFEGRYLAMIVDDTIYLQNALAYVFRNPVAAGLCADAVDWPWSSYRAAMGRAAQPKFLTLTWLPQLFVAPTLVESRALLAERVHKEQEEYADLIRAAAEGPQTFKRRVRRTIGATLYRAELPRSYRALARPPLSDLFSGVDPADRRTTILRAHVVHGYLLVEIANYLGLHPTTISRVVNQTGSYRLADD